MPKDKIELQEQERINLKNAYEIEFWTNEFRVSEVKLRHAIDEVGTKIVAIRRYFLTQG